MKRVWSVLLGVLLAACHSLAGYAWQDIFSVETYSATPQKELAISVAKGEVLEFTAVDLESRMGIASGELRGITVSKLPESSQGAFYLYGVEVEPYQFISRDELDELCFAHGENAVAASLTLTPQGADSSRSRLTISVLGEVNGPPVIESAGFTTVRGVRLSGEISAVDPDGDAVMLQVVRRPEKGDFSLDGLRFVYDPYPNASGSDSFVLRAVDRFGNYSGETGFDIKIERGRSGFYFSDMASDPSGYAAYRLHEKGVLSGEKIGGSWFFHPSRQITRGDYLVMLLSATGMDGELRATVNTKLENDADIALWLKPYVQKALDEGVISALKPFAYDEVPTRAEAVQMVSIISGITDVKDFSLKMPDASAIPEWALPAYKNLAAYRMLDLHDGYAHPERALDNAYAADLLWQLYKHCRE